MMRIFEAWWNHREICKAYILKIYALKSVKHYKKASYFYCKPELGLPYLI